MSTNNKLAEAASSDTRLSKVRNIGIMAHIDAGKTTVTERILYLTGRIHRIQEVHDGGATMDYLVEERERGITITSAATACDFDGHDITIIDTPGHVDFTIEVARSLRVLDGAVAVFCAAAGVEAQSETVWRQADRHDVPRIALINKMDRIEADFPKAVQSMVRRLHANPIPIQWPLSKGREFEGIMDLVDGKAWMYPQETDGLNFTEEPIPEAAQELFQEKRQAMIESLADLDDTIAELFLEGEEVPAEEIRRALRAVTLATTATPVLCGTALKNKGIKQLLSAVVDYLPSPADRPATEGTDPSSGEPLIRSASRLDPTCALAFKTLADRNGDLTFLRVYSGSLTVGDSLLNTSHGKSERIGRLYRMHAGSKEKIAEAYAGDIIAVMGLKNVHTGDTLCDEEDPIALESLEFPEPVTWQAIEPVNRADQDKLGEVLMRLAREDPSFRFSNDEATSEMIISGMGELHLEIIVNKLRRDWRIPVATGKPEVAYKQTIKKEVEIEARHVKQTGGRGQFAVAKVRIGPESLAGKVEFTEKIVGGVIPREYISAVEKGLRGVCEQGSDLGYPLVDIKAHLYDGKFHEVDSSEMAFQSAGRLAMVLALEKAGIVLLEPRMNLEVNVPEKHTGDVVGDLNSRRVLIQEMVDEDGNKCIRGIVPIAEMFRYADTLASLTSGRGSFSMEPHDYEVVPTSLAEAIIDIRRKQRQK